MVQEVDTFYFHFKKGWIIHIFLYKKNVSSGSSLFTTHSSMRTPRSGSTGNSIDRNNLKVMLSSPKAWEGKRVHRPISRVQEHVFCFTLDFKSSLLLRTLRGCRPCSQSWSCLPYGYGLETRFKEVWSEALLMAVPYFIVLWNIEWVTHFITASLNRGVQPEDYLRVTSWYMTSWTS